MRKRELYSIADIVDKPYNFEFVYMDPMYNSRDEFVLTMASLTLYMNLGSTQRENLDLLCRIY